MLGIYVSVPVACFRKGLAREYLETEPLPPPSTCYGFLLSLVGEPDRNLHRGVRVTPMLLTNPDLSTVLRTVWRIKTKQMGGKGNTRPDYQQLLTGTELIIWLDSSEEQPIGPNLEKRVAEALERDQRSKINRFGGLSLGESTHLVNEVSLVTEDRHSALQERFSHTKPRIYRLAEQGLVGLPVWVDHVGSKDTLHVVGEIAEIDDIGPPPLERMPMIPLPAG